MHTQMQIVTERLILHAATPTILRTELAFVHNAEQRMAFEQLLDAQLSIWPPLYNDEVTVLYMLDKLTTHPDSVGWGQWYVLLKGVTDKPLLVASAGFHNPPDADGNVEIGYSVIEPYQRQGIATETVKALTSWAFEHAEIAKVAITTLDTPELVPSTKVAQKCGYRFVGSRESDVDTLLVYELGRGEYKQGENR